MVNTKFEVQRQTIYYYQFNGIHNAKEIQKKTGIPLHTVQYNIKKLEETGKVDHRRQNGCKTKVTQTMLRAIGQHVRKNTAISTRQLATKIQNTQNVSISHSSIWEHIKKNFVINK